MNRRVLLAGMAAGIWAGRVAAAVPSAATRPFAIDDYLRRETIVDLAFSPPGDRWAIQIQRPLAARGFYAMGDTLITPRCDIWLRGAEGPLVSITSGPEWYVSPVFSPSGKYLAIAKIDRHGRVTAQIHCGGSGAHLWSPPVPDSLDLSVLIARQGVAASTMQWLDDTQLVAITTSSEYQPRPISTLRVSEIGGRQADEGVNGGPSVRRWQTDSRQTCGIGSSVVAVSLPLKKVSVWASGDIRMVSISPDATRAAIIRAIGRPPLRPKEPMSAPLGETAGGYEDTRVELRLSILSLLTGDETPTDFKDIGRMSSAFAPAWSPDGQRLAVPCRTAYSSAPGDSALWSAALTGRTVAATTVPALSPLDAVIKAHCVAATLSDAVARQTWEKLSVAKRQALLGRDIGGQAGQVGAFVFALVGDQMRIVSTVDQKLTVTEEVDEASLVQAGEAMIFEAGRKDRWRYLLHPFGLHREAVASPSPDTVASFSHPAQADTFCVEDRDTDTRLIRKGASGRATVLLTCNRHFANVRRPVRELVNYPAQDGSRRYGILYWPTSRGEPQTPPPVVVYAYPQSEPGLRSRLGQPNSSAGWLFQALLSEGFAVFHAAFPVDNAVAYNQPFERAPREILPALDALDHRKDIKTGSYGFLGHSNGGYAALALGSQTDRFKAIVAAAAFPDSFETDLAVTSEIRYLDCAPEIVQARRLYLEAPHVPYAYGTDPVSGVDLYLKNSPLYNLKHYRTPTLLLYGEYDVALPAVEKMFLALQAAGVPAELNTYWADGHVLSNPSHLRDATERQIAWFKRWL